MCVLGLWLPHYFIMYTVTTKPNIIRLTVTTHKHNTLGNLALLDMHGLRLNIQGI